MSQEELQALCDEYDQKVARLRILHVEQERLKQETRDLYQRIENQLKLQAI